MPRAGRSSCRCRASRTSWQSAADLVKGKAAGLPVAVVRGRADLVGSLDLPGARSIIRPAERDMFRLGADEAYAEGFAAGAAAGGPGDAQRS